MVSRRVLSPRRALSLSPQQTQTKRTTRSRRESTKPFVATTSTAAVDDLGLSGEGIYLDLIELPPSPGPGALLSLHGYRSTADLTVRLRNNSARASACAEK